MNRSWARLFLLIFASLFASQAWAQAPASPVEETTARPTTPAARLAPAARSQLFGAIPVSTHSEEARKLVEQAIEQYENVLLNQSVASARKAAEKDPQFALAFAVWSFAARRATPNATALARAKSLLPNATPGEQLLVRWMTCLQQDDMLPAIAAMNDLLARYPQNKHILFLTSEWLYFQQDFERSRKMMESVLKIDPDFPPVLNMLGYSYIETGDPDPAKAIAFLTRYAALLPNHPNPQDSLGEILRDAGDDQGSLEHFTAALKIAPDFISSQVGLGDTSTLMGNYTRARSEYDKAIPVATNSRDRMHAEFQKALVYFWEGQPAQGRKALDALLEKAHQQKEPYAQFEIGFGRALLAPDLASEEEHLRSLETSLQKPVAGMTDADRNVSMASLLRELARISALNGRADAAQEAIAKLKRFAVKSRDLGIENNYESARGYLLFAQGDLANAADELAADPHSPFAVQQFALAQAKLGNAAAAESARTRLKYLRAPTVEWYVVAHSETRPSH